MLKPSAKTVEDAPTPARPTETERAAVTPSSLALLLFAVAVAACGQLLLKYGMKAASAGAAAHGGSLALQAARTPSVLLGLLLFGLSAVAWMATLARVPLSVAYPFNALGYLVILAASALLLHERTNLLTWLGTGLVTCGLLVIIFSQAG